MRLTALLLLLVLAAPISCTDKKRPQGIMSHEQMADLMIDIYLAEARTSSLPTNRDSTYLLFARYQDSLMRSKGIRDSVLRKSYEYYLGHTDELEAIYDVVIDSLSLLEQQTRPTPPENP